MEIRQWYGYNGEYNKNLKINICLDELLELYSKAIIGYFADYSLTNYLDVLNLEKENLSKSQLLFLKWLADNGFPYLTSLVTIVLPEDDQLIAKIEYDKYILEEEMDFQYPEDVRSMLIGIINDFPEYISSAQEVSSTNEYNSFDDESILSKMFKYNNSSTTIKVPYKIKENDTIVSKYKESVQMTGSLFIF
ncbi:hypothetical protein P4U90_20690 [Cytobacillus kochii]|uniref:hypothetical protein n=1 Tax=Cytobacillus kochii TaxID=859143 RepID=UPI002E232A8B|nr:hypothetical protein [Cytobacillus kochii]